MYIERKPPLSLLDFEKNENHVHLFFSIRQTENARVIGYLGGGIQVANFSLGLVGQGNGWLDGWLAGRIGG